jgi:hypothetical protein
MWLSLNCHADDTSPRVPVYRAAAAAVLQTAIERGQRVWRRQPGATRNAHARIRNSPRHENSSLLLGHAEHAGTN